MANRALLLAGTVSLAAFAAQPSIAADMPVKAPVVRPAVAVSSFSWTGCYIGAHAGGGWGRKEWYDTQPPVKFAEHDVDGWLVGGQVGCDIQTSSFVFGFEGQAAWADVDGGGANIATNLFTSNSKVDFISTVTGRLGYAWDRALLYVKGGGAWARDKHWQFDVTNNVILNSGRVTRSGWTVGGGLEWAFTANWSGKIEYNYIDFGRRGASLTGTDDIRPEIDQHLHILKVGLNYRFGGGGIAARY